ncbi:hypothetical protein CMO91_01840 [Candidatus Woesearchaeota archaeon]|nr:hypothetical protein [Candidatus Woesearchaeota archaeon]
MLSAYCKTMDREVLIEAGLTDGESRVYLALLDLGSSTTGPIIQKSGVTRSFIYEILDKLIKLGLITYVAKDRTKYYQAADPKRLLEGIKEQEDHLKQSKTKVEKLIPELMAKLHASNQSEVRVYQGFKGMIAVHEQTYNKLKRGDAHCYFGGAEQPKEHHLFWQRDHVRRGKLGIKSKILFNQDTPTQVLNNRNSYKGCDARYMPIKFDSPTYFLVYKDTVVVYIPTGQNPEDMLAVEIVKQEVADSFQEFFDEFWKRSDPRLQIN